MAIAYRSVATTDFAGSTTSLVISKPSGLAVNDTMIARIVYEDNADTVDTPDGWTKLSEYTTGKRQTIFSKTADSSDVAASNFTFTFTNTVDTAGGSIMAWTGVGAINIGSISRINSSTSTPTFTTGVTPAVANSYLIFLYWSTYTHTVSSYAITTNNPSWTEIADENKAGPDTTMSIAYASRPETSATGNFTATSSTTHDDHVGQLLYLYPRTNVNLSMPVGTLTLTSPTPSLTVDVIVQMPVGTLSVSGGIPTVTTSETDVWTEETKNSSTVWVEDTK